MYESVSNKYKNKEMIVFILCVALPLILLIVDFLYYFYAGGFFSFRSDEEELKIFFDKLTNLNNKKSDGKQAN